MKVRVRDYFKPTQGVMWHSMLAAIHRAVWGGGPANVTIKRKRRPALTHSTPVGSYPVGVSVQRMQGRDPFAVG